VVVDVSQELKERFDRKLDYLYRNETELYKLYRDDYVIHSVITQIYIIDDQSLEAAKTEIIKIQNQNYKKLYDRFIERVLTEPIPPFLYPEFKPK
jgi:hypothetical protein